LDEGMTILGVEKVNGANTSYFTCNVVGTLVKKNIGCSLTLAFTNFANTLKQCQKKKIVESVYE
jgi:hypothetical protein